MGVEQVGFANSNDHLVRRHQTNKSVAFWWTKYMRKLFLLTLSCLLCLLSLSVFAQTSPQQPQQPQPQQSFTPAGSEEEDDTVIKVTTLNIALPVTVFDEKGRFVTNLKKDNFRIFENNDPQPLVGFRLESDMPLNVALLMDTSTSVRNRLEFEKVAIKQFLSTVLRSNRDRLAFVTFDTDVNIREELTSDVAKVNRTVDDIKVIGGQTSIYDAIFKVCRETMARTNTRRRVIVAISDGADTNSKHTLNQTIEIAQRTQTSIYAISTKGGGVFRVEGSPYLNTDDRDLKKLCRETGGDVFFPSDAEELTKAFQLVNDFLRNQYLLVYEPTTNTDGSFHKIDVRVVGKKGLSTLTRNGYIAK